MKQCEIILRHLEDYGSITPREAMDEYGIYRLGARIWDLRASGHDISTEMIASVNRYGEKTHFAKYTLQK